MGDGWTSQTIPGGDQVQGQVTLDLCGTHFPSESLRIARHQITLTSPGGSGSAETISNEVVIYQFRGDAMSAVYGGTTNGQPDPATLQAAADAAALLQSSAPVAS